MRRFLGFTTRCQLDGFLNAHDIWVDYRLEDFQREIDSLKKLGV